MIEKLLINGTFDILEMRLKINEIIEELNNGR